MKHSTRVCRDCNKTKVNRLFPVNRRVCKSCMVARAKIHRNANREKSREHARGYSYRGRHFLLSYLMEHPCVKCGEDNPILLDFDHIDPSTKKFSVSNRVTCHPRLLEEEIEKCQVLCVKCHRLKTVTQAGWYQAESLKILLAKWLP